MDEADLDAYLGTAQQLAWIFFLLWALLAHRVKHPAWVLIGTAGWCAYLWAITNLPLGRLYALGVGSDRLNNVALCVPVAAGSSFLETFQVGQRNFEPLWSLVVAALSGWSPERALALYPYLSLLVIACFLISLYASLRPPEGTGQAGEWSSWERVFAVFFALMLSTSPDDHMAPYRATWNSFLLKPNHNLALVLVPPLLAMVARLRGWRGRVAAGFLLQGIGVAFVLQWVYVSAGLVVYALVAGLRSREEFRKALLDVGVVLGINLLLVSPYLYTLFTSYPFTVRHESLVLGSIPAHLLRVTLDQGVILPLAFWGGYLLYRRGDRLARLWVSLAVAGFGIWIGYIGLSWAHLVREADELYYFLRIVSGIFAGIAAWDVARRLGAALELRPQVIPTALLLLSFPLALPSWWNPRKMDPYFEGSLPALPDPLLRTMTFVRAHTAPQEAFIAGKMWSRYVAALGARRLLIDFNLHAPPDYEDRVRLQAAVLLGGDPAAARELRRYGVRYVLVDPDLLRRYGVNLDRLSEYRILRKVFAAGDEAGDFWAVFRIELDG